MKVPTYPEFATLVRQMREAQVKYFREHTQSTLKVAIQCERRVDDALNTIQKYTDGIPEQMDLPTAP